MSNKYRNIILSLTVFIAVLSFGLLFKPGQAFAIVQSIFGDVSIAGAHAVTDNPTSYYEVESPSNGSTTNIQVKVSILCGSSMGFDLSVLYGGSNPNFRDPGACGGGGTQYVNYTMDTSATCNWDANHKECRSVIYITADGASSGHFSYWLDVNGSANITYDSSIVRTSNPAGGSWPSGGAARQFGLWPQSQSFNFDTPCTMPDTFVYVGWNGVDYGASYQPTSSHPSWTLLDNGTPLKTESDGTLGTDLQASQVFSYGFWAKAGHHYSWQWSGVDQSDGGNEVVFSLPYTESSFHLGQTCGPPPPSWTLLDSSSYSPSTIAPGQSVNFTWQIQNQGPSAATYHWHIQQSYGGGSGSYYDNGQTGSPSNVPPGAYNPGPPPNIGNSPVPWPSTTSAPSGSKFCERIVYYYANGPSDSAATIGGPDCITLAVPTTPTCTYLPSFTDPGAAAGNSKLHSASFVRVVDSNGNQLVPQGGNPTQTFTAANFTSTYPAPAYAGTYVRVTQSATQGPWSYTPMGTNITVYTVREVHNTDTVAHSVYGKSIPAGAFYYYPNPQVPNPPFGHDGTIGPCYGATANNTSGACSLTVSGGNGPGGVVTAGQGGVTVTGTIYNNNSSPYAIALPPNLPNGDGLSLTSGGPHYYGAAIPVGAVSGPISWGIGINGGPNPSYQTVTAYPDYYGNGPIGPACSITFPVYAPFTLTPGAQTTLTPTIEAPTSVNNKTWVTESGAAVNENVTSSLYYTSARCGSPTVASTSNGGPFNPGSTTYLFNPGGTPYSYGPCMPLTAGDTYCSQINVPVASGGFVGPAGDIVGGTGATASSCPKVVNEPFFKVNNSSVSTGSSFPDSAGTCKGGELAGWNNNTGSWPTSESFGAGSELNALAALGITGFGTNQKDPPPLNYPPTNLSFANKNVPINIDTDSPSLGGYFGNTNCYQGPSPLIGSTNLPSGDINALASSGKASYTYTGNLDLYGGSINPGTNLAIYVTGNVYIHPGTANGITYNGSGGWTLANIPSFVLSASGNIYIDPGVSELDGLYNAQPNTANVGGNIYTCGVNSGGGNFTYMDKDSLYTSCNKQLVVYGMFQANHVNLMRTLGSLRDETPVSGGSIPGPNIDTSVAFNRYWCGGNGSDLGVHLYQNTWNFQPSITGSNNSCNTPEFNPGGLGYILPAPGGVCDTPGAVPLWWAWDPTIGRGNFYTTSTGEPHTSIIGCVPTGGSPGSIEPVYRLYDHAHGGHFWTIFQSEDAHLLSTDPNLTDEGIGFYVYTSAGQGGQPTSIPIGAHQPNPPSCSNNGGGLLTSTTCAAEVFDLSQELYLSQPSIEPPNHGTLQLHSLTSLPPIL